VFNQPEIIDDENLVHKTHYENGQLKEQFVLLDGKLHGTYLYYDKSGHLRTRLNFLSAVLYGTSYYFNSAGELVQKAQYKDGKLHGRMCVYENNGLQLVAQYKNNLKNGILTIVNAKKQVICRQPFVEDKLQGISNFFGEQGNLVQLAEYEKGLLHGKLIYYNKEGKEISHQLFEHGEPVNNNEGSSDDHTG